MIRLLFLFLTIIHLTVGFSQDPEISDSLRQVIEADSTITDYYYQDFKFANGNLIGEGWVLTSFYDQLSGGSKTDILHNHIVDHWTYYRKSGNVRFKAFLPLNPQDSAYWNDYFRSGSLQLSRVYVPAENRAAEKDQGRSNIYAGIYKLRKYTISRYFKNGNLKYRGKGKGRYWDGALLIYYKSGTLWEDYQYGSNGKLNGPYTYYRKNGAVQISGYYTNGKRSGDWKWFKADGTLRKEKTQKRKGP